MTSGLRYAKMIGFLQVRKNTTGDVMITVSPPVVLVTTKPVILATGALEVDYVIKNSNIEKLERDQMISLVF